MKTLVAWAALCLLSARVLAEEIGANDDVNYWSDWSDGDQSKEELPLPFEHFLQRIARRPRPQQFFGLMGKRDGGYGQISHKRHKTDSFVGLMGKRSLNSDRIQRRNTRLYPYWFANCHEAGAIQYSFICEGKTPKVMALRKALYGSYANVSSGSYKWEIRDSMVL